MRTISLFAAFASVSSILALNPFRTEAPGGGSLESLLNAQLSKDGPYDTFVNHFSAETTGTDVYLQTRMKSMYPNSTVTVTQDYRFNLLQFARENSDQVLIRPLDDLEMIKRVVYLPALRRRDGDGFVAESLVFGGYTVAWGEHEMTAIVASWQEGFQYKTQWHLIGSSTTVAEQLIHACASYMATIRNAIMVFDQGFWEADHNLWESVQKASWDEVTLDEDFKNRLIGDYRSFLKAEKTYKDLSVPWKRGLIFLGPPGNGKTISLKAIMKDVKIPALYVKTLHSFSGDEYAIRQIFTFARQQAPCVLILEDLDSLITDDNRSFFLNEVDGLEDNDGLLMIGTTNHVDRLDPALSSRPSRFDRRYSFPDPKRAERRHYAVYWQNKLKSNHDIVFPDSLIDKVAEKTDKFSFAYLKEAFVSALLTLAGRDDDPKKGEDFPNVLLDQIKRLREQLNEGAEFNMPSAPQRIDVDMAKAHAAQAHYTPMQKTFGSKMAEKYGSCEGCVRVPGEHDGYEGVLKHLIL